MQSQTQKRYLTYLLLVASLTLSAASASPQERRAQPNDEHSIIQSPCPRPIALTLTAATPNVFNSDFTPAQLAAPRAWLNDPAINKHFLYTFQLPLEGRCCEIRQAVLTVKMRSNSTGMLQTSSDAGNDGINIMHNGSSAPPYSQSVYSSWPFGSGQPVTKQWTLSGVALSNINANRRLSIDVQDDTMVQSATLRISGCCLTAR